MNTHSENKKVSIHKCVAIITFVGALALAYVSSADPQLETSATSALTAKKRFGVAACLARQLERQGAQTLKKSSRKIE